jgi:hypothetical protein
MKPDHNNQHRPDDELLRRYHEANAHDTLRPAPALRDAVLARARAAAQDRGAPGSGRPTAANDGAWRWRAFGGLAVLGLATLVVLQFDRGAPEERETALGQPPAPQAVPAAPAVPAPADTATAAREVAPPAPAPQIQDTESGASAPAGIAAAPRARALERGEAPTPSPDTALLAAAARGTVAEARAALERGARVDAVNANGRTALMAAAQRGDAPLVRLLLDAGADPLRTDRDGLRAADLARQAGHGALLPLLEEGRAR